MRRSAGLLPASVLAALLAMSGGILAANEQERGDGGIAAHGYRLAAEQGDAEAQFNLGVRYFHGRGVPEDLQEAIHWVRLAAEQGHAEARISLGVLYDEGRGVPQDHEEAVRWYRLAAEQGHPAAQFNLGVSYDEGAGVPQDHVEAVRWYRLAAGQGDSEAQFNLGVSYDNGRGVARDTEEAVRWYRLAAEQGSPEAQFNLGVRHYEGAGTSQDYDEALRWFRLSARQDNPEARFALGIMYDGGEGVPRDHREATRWYRLAAEQGHAKAQYNLGVAHTEGEGVAQDHGEAERWYRLAAEQGHAGAPLNLGVSYANGLGVSQDYHEAARWFRMAAERGQPKAWYYLGVMYHDGLGFSRDLVQAHKWFDLASSRSDEAAAARDAVAALLTPSQLLEARRLANEWRGGSGERSVGSGSSRGQIAFARRSTSLAGTGSGFRVSGRGHVLTNAHVVRGCHEVRVGPETPVRVVARDDASDLALLEEPAAGTGAFARFREGRGVRPGDSIVVVGFPLRGIVASEPSVTLGNVSALAGPGDDRRLFQVTAPVQPGNSGGPVLDMAGNAVGVVIAKLDAIAIAQATGDIPQNVNFAIGAGVARAFLDAENVPYETAPSEPTRMAADIAASARGFTVPIECWRADVDGPLEPHE